MKKLLSLVLVLAMVLSLSACSSNDGTTTAAQTEGTAAATEAGGETEAAGGSGETGTFVIGGLGPLTGDSASYGTSVKQGAEIAIEEINAAGGVEAMPANSTTTMLGITTLQMGVFGGIVVGLGVAALHNKFYKIELPQVLAFFGGTRFVPIISSIVYLVVGIGAIVASWHWEVAARAQRRSEELARQRVAYLEEYENAQAQVRAVAHLRHDLRNEMAAARALQERGRAEEARRLLCAMAERVSTEEMPEGGSL